jgi:DNA-binding transcriptional LysR family regulator
MIDMVEGGFDVAIRNARLKDSSLIAKKLAVDTRIVCASPEYLAQFGVPSKPEDLLHHQCMYLTGLDTWTFNTVNGSKSIKISGMFRTDNGEAVRDAAVIGLGITISSIWNCYQQIASGELVQVLKDYPLASDTAIWAVYPSSRLLAPKVRAFIDYFSQCYAGVPYWEQ